MIRRYVVKPLRCENLMARLLIIGGISVAGMAMLSGSGALAQQPGGTAIPPQSHYGTVRIADGVSDADLQALMEEDENTFAEDRSACRINPSCSWQDGEYVVLDPNVDNRLYFYTDIFCGETMSYLVTFDIFIPVAGNGNVVDSDSPREFYLDVPAGTFHDGDFGLLALLVKDNSNRRFCLSKLIVVFKGCESRPACYFNNHECDSGPEDERSEIMMGTYDVKTGDILPVLELCARSRCDNGSVARVELFSRPPFLEPISHRKGHPGAKVCISTRENDVVEGGFAEGTYWAKFKCTDTSNGEYRIIKVGFRYTDPSPDPDPDPASACSEDETNGLNDKFANASVIDSGECADDAGVNLYGSLDMPLFINGDVDYFRVTGLEPGSVYEATIVAGMTPGNVFTDTLLGWFVGPGEAVAVDDNSGPLLGYSRISFSADGSGEATLAVTGHGDDDFNGIMDPSMPYEMFGFGDYQLSIKLVDQAEAPLERRADFNSDGIVDTADLSVMIAGFGLSIEQQADLNGDGVVDTADLGMLLGVFGMSSN